MNPRMPEPATVAMPIDRMSSTDICLTHRLGVLPRQNMCSGGWGRRTLWWTTSAMYTLPREAHTVPVTPPSAGGRLTPVRQQETQQTPVRKHALRRLDNSQRAVATVQDVERAVRQQPVLKYQHGARPLRVGSAYNRSVGALNCASGPKLS
jgi:hypothetical protein